MSKLIFLVLGPPGSGKGTFCTNIISRQLKKQSIHLSAGQLLREFANTPEETLKDQHLIQELSLVKLVLRESKIVPAEITVSLLLRSIRQTPKSQILIDGFPRNMDNLEAWTEAMRESPDLKLSNVIHLECRLTNE